MEYTNTDKMPWGKHKGLIIKFVPTPYLRYAINNFDGMDDDLRDTFEEELQRRIDENDHTWDD